MLDIKKSAQETEQKEMQLRIAALEFCAKLRCEDDDQMKLTQKIYKFLKDGKA